MARNSDESRNARITPPHPRRAGKADERDIGAALRTAYQQTVDEIVPADLLDLLGKLS
jgi:hypothetical protein